MELIDSSTEMTCLLGGTSNLKGVCNIDSGNISGTNSTFNIGSGMSLTASSMSLAGGAATVAGGAAAVPGGHG